MSAHRASPKITVVTSESAAIGKPRTVVASDSQANLPNHKGVGQHLIVDFWGARYLSDVGQLEKAICLAVEAANATLLHIHLHRFDDGGGVTGVALLAESHISVHTWPEQDYAAFDIFMCGNSDPARALDVLRHQLAPKRQNIQQIARG